MLGEYGGIKHSGGLRRCRRRRRRRVSTEALCCKLRLRHKSYVFCRVSITWWMQLLSKPVSLHFEAEATGCRLNGSGHPVSVCSCRFGILVDRWVCESPAAGHRWKPRQQRGCLELGPLLRDCQLRDHLSDGWNSSYKPSSP